MSNSVSTTNTGHNLLLQNIQKIKHSIADSCGSCQRSVDSVLLLAVTKTHPVSVLEHAYQLGLRAFGENYVQEGVAKISALNELIPHHEAIWHFIGPLQSNKTKPVAEHFAWVHGVERFKIAQRLSEQRPSSMANLNVLIQVNISDENSKSGCEPADALELALQIIELPHVTLRGLMTIPAAIDQHADELTQQAPFKALAQLHATIKSHLPEPHAAMFDTLSMGMSDDFPHAIAAGATLIRVGSALFGARPSQPHL